MRVELIAPHDHANGFGTMRDDLVRELQTLGVHIGRNISVPHVSLVMGVPNSLKAAATPNTVLFTMFESEKIPPTYVEWCQKAKIVVVPTRWCKRVFDAEAKINSVVVPLGVDTSIFTYRERAANAVFTVLNYNAFTYRKGFWSLLGAWERSLGGRKDAQLILKYAGDNNVTSMAEYDNIHVLKGKYTRGQLASLLYLADAFVFPSMGEGFGLPPIEAAATGLRPIIPDASGMSEFANEIGNIVATTTPVVAKYESFARSQVDLGHYLPVDKEDLARVLTEEYARWKDNPVTMSNLHVSKVVQEKYDIRRTAKQLLTVLQDAAN